MVLLLSSTGDGGTACRWRSHMEMGKQMGVLVLACWWTLTSKGERAGGLHLMLPQRGCVENGNMIVFGL